MGVWGEGERKRVCVGDGTIGRGKQGRVSWLTWTMCDYVLTLVVFKAKLCGLGRWVLFLVQNVDFEL